MAHASKAITKGDGAPTPVRVSGRHFTPRPTKPGIGRPVRGRVPTRSGGGGERT